MFLIMVGFVERCYQPLEDQGYWEHDQSMFALDDRNGETLSAGDTR